MYTTACSDLVWKTMYEKTEKQTVKFGMTGMYYVSSVFILL